MRLKSYKDLEVWQKAVSLAVQVYRVTNGFPRDERFGLTSQIRRAATSVSANIAEGWGRGSVNENVQFLTIARGSLLELESHLYVASQLKLTDSSGLTLILKDIESVSMMLTRLIQALRRKTQ